MYSSVRHEIPEFLVERVVYCDNLVENRGNKFCLLLTRNLHFYEFQQKQLRRSIDLSRTCLSKVAEYLQTYKGPKGKWYESSVSSSEEFRSDQGLLTDATNFITQELQGTHEIIFGKYVYTNLEIKKLYVLLRCCDKLLVLRRLGDSMQEGYKIANEFEQVRGYRLVHGNVKYQAVVEIEFKSGETVRTDFQTAKEEGKRRDTEKSSDFGTADNEEFKKLLERVRTTQAELQVHKAITQHELEQLRETQAFGCPFLRSFKPEEKQMVARCGDIWLRVTPDGSLVIGVPLVNNFAAPNLNILKNFRPVLQVDAVHSRGLSYRHRLYQLECRFEDLVSLETLFQSEDAQLQLTSWVSADQQQLLPDTYAVLLIQFRIPDIVTMTKCPLLLYFEIEKDLELSGTKVPKTRIFEQQLFLKNIDFHRVLCHRLAYEIDFKETSLHQDFLAAAFTSVEIKLRIKFASPHDVILFEDLLVTKFKLKLIQRTDKDATSVGAMEVDMQEQGASSSTASSLALFYNKEPVSLWHGLLAIRAASEMNAEADKLQMLWKFYAKNEENAFLLLKMLFSDLLLDSCNLLHVEYLEDNDGHDVKLIEFENAMRQELKAKLNLLNNKPNRREIPAWYIKVLESEAQTDFKAAL